MIVGNRVGKLTLQVLLNIAKVEVLECPHVT